MAKVYKRFDTFAEALYLTERHSCGIVTIVSDEALLSSGLDCRFMFWNSAVQISD
jgi:hypothetical protein